jgi:hypothetical protein
MNACQSKIAYIGTDSPLDLQPMIPYIRDLSLQVPSAELRFEIIPVSKPDTIVEISNRVESLISKYVSQGFEYIGLPTDVNLLNIILTGEGGNIPINQRWPNTFFMVQDYLPTGLYYSNVHTFTDINTLMNESLIKYNLTSTVKNSGQVYVIYQNEGSDIGIELMEIARKALNELRIQAKFYEVNAPNNIFNVNEIRNIVNDIWDTVPPEPAQSAIIHIIDWFDSENYILAGLRANLFTSFEDRLVHSSFANEFYPTNTTIPVRLNIGRIPVIGLPSLNASSIGLPLLPSEYYSFPYLISYLDSYLWAATCKRTNGINDKELRFDSTNMRISYFLADQFILENTIHVYSGPFYFNPRWFDELAPVVPRR